MVYAFLLKIQLNGIKIATLTYHTRQSGSPSYLPSLININITHRTLCSSSLNLLHVPPTTNAVGCKAFRFAAPTVLKAVPQIIRPSSSILFFKRSLKTYLYVLEFVLYTNVVIIIIIIFWHQLHRHLHFSNPFSPTV